MFYKELLKRELERRKAKNPRYSLTAFARDIGLTPAAVSLVLSGQRHLSRRTLQSVATTLKWSEEELNEALEEMRKRPRMSAKTKTQDADPYPVNEWYFWATWQLAGTNTAVAESAWLSSRLGIEESEATFVLNSLRELELIDVVDGFMRRRQTQLPKRLAVLILRKALEALEDKTEHAPTTSDLLQVALVPGSVVKELKSHFNQVASSQDSISSVVQPVPMVSDEPMYAVVLQTFPVTKT